METPKTIEPVYEEPFTVYKSPSGRWKVKFASRFDERDGLMLFSSAFSSGSKKGAERVAKSALSALISDSSGNLSLF